MNKKKTYGSYVLFTLLTTILVIGILSITLIKKKVNQNATEVESLSYKSLGLTLEQLKIELNSLFSKYHVAIQLTEVDIYNENGIDCFFSQLSDTVSIVGELNTDNSLKNIDIVSIPTADEEETLFLPIVIFSIITIISPELDTNEQIYLLEELGLYTENENLLYNQKNVIRGDRVYSLKISSETGVVFSVENYSF